MDEGPARVRVAASEVFDAPWRNPISMDLEVLVQPYRESASTGETFITTALGDEDVSRVLIVTAWVRSSGMELLTSGLQALRQRGGTARLIFGVDLGGTSQQGVALAQRNCADVHVVHDPSGRTFHPKIYLAVGERVGYVLIGSNNLSAGGLWHNYEAAVTAVFDPQRESRISDGVEQYARQLLGDGAICKKLTQGVFDRLIAEGWLADEKTDRRHHTEDCPVQENSRDGQLGAPLFAPSQFEKRERPVQARLHSNRADLSRRTRRRFATAPNSWWKPLGAGDAQHPRYGKPTGNVALTHVPRDQDRITYFRKVFFGAERWRSEYQSGKRSELATINAEIEIDADRLGRHAITLVYRPYRRERGRATTVLRWGESLLEELRNRDVTGWHLLIERADPGSYCLRVTPRQPV